MSAATQQANLFAPDALDTDVSIPKASDRDLLHDAADAAAMLAMGDGGIAAHVAARLRGELLTAVRELAHRWGEGGPA